jgi:hypothetical protein
MVILGGWIQETKTFTYEMTHFLAQDKNML